MSKTITLTALINRHRLVPDNQYLSLVEATSFVAFKAFIPRDGIERAFQSAVENGTVVGRFRKAVEKAREEETLVPQGETLKQWLRASEEIRKKAHDGELTFHGRQAQGLRESAAGEEKQIEVGFFAGENTLVVGLDDKLYRNDASRDGYYEGVRVKTAEFMAAFPAPKAKRGPTASEKEAVLNYSRQRAQAGQPPSFRDVQYEFPQLTRDPLRKIIAELPPELRRAPGKKTHKK